MRELLATQKYPVLLGCISIAILVGGMLLKPEKANIEAVVSESETNRLEKLAEKKSLETMTEFFSTLARDAGRQIVYLPAAGAAGIVWNGEGIIVTIRDNVPSHALTAIKLPDRREIMANPKPSSPPIRSLQIADGPARKAISGVTKATVSRDRSWVVQVSRRQDGELFFTPGLNRGVRPVSCGETILREIDTSIDFTARMVGGGLFDLDGGFLGVLVPCGDRVIALPAADIERALNNMPGPQVELEETWGMKVSPLDAPARKYFRTEQGLLVQEVRKNGPASRAGVLPGDVLTILNNEPLNATLDLLRLGPATLPEGSSLSAYRRGRKQTLNLSAMQPARSAKPEAADEIGIEIEAPPVGFLVENVSRGSAASEAGVRPGDRLLELNGARLRAQGDVQRLLRSSTGTARYLLLSRGDRLIGVLLP